MNWIPQFITSTHLGDIYHGCYKSSYWVFIGSKKEDAEEAAAAEAALAPALPPEDSHIDDKKSSFEDSSEAKTIGKKYLISNKRQ
jgi:hypothetical protein